MFLLIAKDRDQCGLNRHQIPFRIFDYNYKL